jgi:hypothetical protein
MSVGTIVTVHEGKIIKREPVWPFPSRESFPRTNADGSISHFLPRPYYHFPIGGLFDASVS